ncbi:MAG: plasmid pRiA4b ORF-3 family protein [Ignavibacteriales bacterium]|nr:plasmid pRiA4b ORF-3 family protein [Ignavibacteriales bacterium]
MHGMQFKIALQGITPPIWRRIVVPENYSFWDLHVAIQDSFGWTDTHLHVFKISRGLEIGIPDRYEMVDGNKFKPGWEVKIQKHFHTIGTKIKYEYDFGDGWVHEVELEKMIEDETKAPQCIDGKRACPPEDCGGIPGYAEFCETMRKKKGEAYKEMVEWFGGDYDAEYFDPSPVKFDKPKKRLKMILNSL